MLGQQATRLNAATQDIGTLSTQFSSLCSRFEELRASAATETSREPEPHANNPPIYDGDPNSCNAFLSQCSLFFSLQPRRYATERSNVAYVLTLLSGKARDWGVAVWDARAPCCQSFSSFRQEMSRLFDRSAQGDEAAARLSRLSQGRSTVTDYVTRFQTLAAACQWNEAFIVGSLAIGLPSVQ